MIPHALSGLSFVERFYTFPTVQSTNDTARSLEHRPEKGLFCIQSDRQTGGRGRRGGSYFSDCSGGLWVSLVVPVENIADHFSYNRAISLAILLTLEQCRQSGSLAIKWPNDIYWNEKKICGILLENHIAHPDVLVIGFGINVNMQQSDFPSELSSIATSVLIETGRKYALTALLRTILKQYHIIVSADSEKVHTAYIAKLFGKGRHIAIDGMTGIFTSVSEDGRLLLHHDNGSLVSVSTGSPIFIPVPDSNEHQ